MTAGPFHLEGTLEKIDFATVRDTQVVQHLLLLCAALCDLNMHAAKQTSDALQALSDLVRGVARGDVPEPQKLDKALRLVNAWENFNETDRKHMRGIAKQIRQLAAGVGAT